MENTSASPPEVVSRSQSLLLSLVLGLLKVMLLPAGLQSTYLEIRICGYVTHISRINSLHKS